MMFAVERFGAQGKLTLELSIHAQKMPAMPTYLWSGKDSTGKKYFERVAANTAAEAKAQLLARGFTELELRTDDISVAAAQMTHNDTGVRPELSPKQEASYLSSKWAPFWNVLWQSKGTILISAALLAWAIWLGRSTSIVFRAGELLLIPVLMLWFALPSRYYSKLNQAKVDHRWEEMLRLIERLRTLQRWVKFGPGEVELARNRAHALAGLGRLDEAVGEFMEFERHPKLPHWMFLSHLAGICDTGKAHDKATALSEQSAKEHPDTAAVWIDVAYRRARFRKDAAGAREALARAETMEVPALGRAYLPWVRALIAVAQNDLPAAHPLFEETLRGLRPHQHHDLIRGMILIVKSYLCWTLGALGRTAEAKNLFAEVEDWLLSGREAELLANCRRVLGRA